MCEGPEVGKGLLPKEVKGQWGYSCKGDSSTR